MFSSTIIPTIGRPTLTRAVQSVLGQTFTSDGFEVIVVNDSGRPLHPADFPQTDRLTIIHTDRRERSIARNAGAAIARGRFLHFLDDDDWLVPGALENIWSLAATSRAAWLYGSSQLVDSAGQPLLQLHHGLRGNVFVQVMAGEWIPLGASFIEAKMFFAVGGFDPLTTGGEDVDLTRRIALRTDLAETPAVLACLRMGADGSSTDRVRGLVLARGAREKILSEPGAFQRLRASATSSYWQGRITRLYFTSMVWNLQRRGSARASGRALFGVASLLSARGHLFAPEFWRAVARPYASPTFADGGAQTRTAGRNPLTTT